MPYFKDNAKMTGDTHLPDVESDMFDEGSADSMGMDETTSDRGQATESGKKRPGRAAGKASAVKGGKKIKTASASSGRG